MYTYLFSHVNKMVCPLECAALTCSLITHRTTMVVSCPKNQSPPLHTRYLSYLTLPTVRKRHGYKTGIKLVLNENSKSPPSLSFFTTPTTPITNYQSKFLFSRAQPLLTTHFWTHRTTVVSCHCHNNHYTQ